MGIRWSSLCKKKKKTDTQQQQQQQQFYIFLAHPTYFCLCVVVGGGWLREYVGLNKNILLLKHRQFHFQICTSFWMASGYAATVADAADAAAEEMMIQGVDDSRN